MFVIANDRAFNLDACAFFEIRHMTVDGIGCLYLVTDEHSEFICEGTEEDANHLFKRITGDSCYNLARQKAFLTCSKCGEYYGDDGRCGCND